MTIKQRVICILLINLTISIFIHRTLLRIMFCFDVTFIFRDNRLGTFGLLLKYEMLLAIMKAKTNAVYP